MAMTPSCARAHALYVGVGNSEQVTIAGNRELSFSLTGQTALASFEISEDLMLGFDYYTANDSVSISQQASGELDIDSWRVNLGYYLDDWSFSISATNWQDELFVDVLRTSFFLRQDTESPSYSANVSYDWYVSDWQISTGLGFHYNDWEQKINSVNTQGRETSAVDSGESSFISTSVSVARFFELSQDQGIILGLNLQWNEIMDTESQAISRNGRNISQINNRQIRQLINSQVPIGSESYGQYSMYLSYDITENWLVDLNWSRDFSSDFNTSAWSLNIGVNF